MNEGPVSTLLGLRGEPAGGRGDHGRARRPARRADRRQGPHRPHQRRGLGGRGAPRQGPRRARHGRGDAPPPAPDRRGRAGVGLRHLDQDEPAPPRRGRPPRRRRGPAGRHHRLHRHRPRAPLASTTRRWSSTMRRSASSASRPPSPSASTGWWRRGLIDLRRLVALLSTNPARVLGLPGGTLAPGSPADVTVLDLGRRVKVNPENFESKGRNTPFGGLDPQGRACDDDRRGPHRLEPGQGLTPPPHVVILGGGFGGLYAARPSGARRCASPSSTAATTTSSSRSSTRSPPPASIPRDIAAPIRSILRGQRNVVGDPRRGRRDRRRGPHA